ncbi:MAG: ribonuclease D [Alphaproteobacteria bacterium]|nr:ribonuclease D [Alphaproteobacteria bacterium]
MPSIILHRQDLPEGIDFGSAVAVDTETTGLNLERDRLCLVQLSAGDGTCHLVQFEKGNYDAPVLKKLLADEKVLKIFHFARFDVAAIKKFLGVDCSPIYCTKIASKLVRTNAVSHSLKALCLELLGVELEKEKQCSDWAAPQLSKEQINYAANDVLYLHQIKKIMDERLEREGRTELAAACFDFILTRSTLDISGWDEDIFAH